MHKRKVASVEDPISPNLIPMIDIMFLLLLFFMLGADMAARETAEMLLAETSKAKEIEDERSEVPESTINIHHDPGAGQTCAVYENGICRIKEHWHFSISGKNYDREELQKQLKMLGDLSPEPAPDPDAKKVLSARKIYIRADRQAPYGDVQKAIEYCGPAGLYKVAVVGAMPPKE